MTGDWCEQGQDINSMSTWDWWADVEIATRKEKAELSQAEQGKEVSFLRSRAPCEKC